MFAFYPELFEHRTKAMECLEARGFHWLQDYSSIDMDHEDFSMEICGIADMKKAKKIRRALQPEFIAWVTRVYLKDYGLEQGWIVEMHGPHPGPQPHQQR